MKPLNRYVQRPSTTGWPRLRMIRGLRRNCSSGDGSAFLRQKMHGEEGSWTSMLLNVHILVSHMYIYILYIYILYQRYNKQIYYFSLNKKCIDIGYDMYIYIYTYIILLLLLLLSLLLLSLLLYIIYSDILGFRKHRDSKYLPSAWESPAVWDLASQWRPPVAFHHPSS